MTIWIISTALVAPAFFWIGYFYYKDRFFPEPLISIAAAYLLGIASALGVILFLRFLYLLRIPCEPSSLVESHGMPFLLYSIFFTGVVEETFKFLPFLMVVLRFRSFNEKTDGIIYAAIIALGFASYENSIYLTTMSGVELFGRAFASPLTHAVFSSIWGYAVGTAKLSGKSIWRASITGLSISAFLHGTFNFFTTSAAWRAASALLILIVWIWIIRILEKAPKKN